MPMRTRISTPSRRGFTLLEMSIVLVIIGLLIGAIVVGQSMIRSSEVNSIGTDVQKYRSAFSSFRLKYGFLPGDLPTAYEYWPSAGCSDTIAISPANAGCNGNGDGVIDAFNWGASPARIEAYRAWQQLSLAGIVAGSFSGVPGPASLGDDVIGTNVPATKISGVGIGIGPAGYRICCYNWFEGTYPVNFIVGRDSGITGDTVSGLTDEFLTPPEAAAIDSKYDDGRPGSGKYRARLNKPNLSCISTNDVATSAYVLTYNSNACMFVIDLE